MTDIVIGKASIFYELCLSSVNNNKHVPLSTNSQPEKMALARIIITNAATLI
jgi:hypothetical protein